MIEFTCPKCGGKMSSPASLAGQQETCSGCGNITIVPQPSSTAQVQTPPTPSAVQPSYRPAPQAAPQVDLNVKVKGIKSTNGLGIAALILGILAALTCWIPFVGMIGMPLAVLGLVFGIIGFLIALVGRKSGVGMPVSGCIVCIIAMVVAITSTGATVDAMDKAVKQTTRNSDGSRSPLVAEKKAYLGKVLLKNIHTGKTVLDETGIFGEVKNIGNRTLKEVEIIVYCLDADGNAIFEEIFHPVLVSDSVFSMRDNKPLKPNYSEKFGYKLNAPSEWSGKVRAEVVDIEFAD